MSGLDLDALRERWQGASTALDAGLDLDTAAVRAELERRSARALRRHMRWLLLSIGFGTALLLALAAFLWNERFDPLYLLAGASLGTLLLAEWIVNVRQWRALATIDYARPVAEVQSVLAGLRTARLRLAKWVALTAVMLWWPGVAVVLKAAFGVDLLRGLHWSVIATSIGLGLLLVPLGLWIMRVVTRRFGDRPSYQRWLDDVAGGSFGRVRKDLEGRERFEQAAAAGDVNSLRGLEAAAREIPAELYLARRVLLRRLLVVSFVYALGVLMMGAFNAAHGGIAWALAAGLTVHFALLAQMVPAIVVRASLMRIDFNESSAELRERITTMARWQRRVAQATAMLSPVIALALGIVTAYVFLRVDAMSHFSLGIDLALLAPALLTSAWLASRWRQAPEQFAEAWCAPLSLSASRLLDALHAQIPPPQTD